MSNSSNWKNQGVGVGVDVGTLNTRCSLKKKYLLY